MPPRAKPAQAQPAAANLAAGRIPAAGSALDLKLAAYKKAHGLSGKGQIATMVFASRLIVAPFTVTAYPADKATTFNHNHESRSRSTYTVQQGTRGWTLYARLHGRG